MSWSSRLAALLPTTVERDAGGTEPDPRFTFANERTFLAWSRTALALVVAGLGIVQLLPPFPGVPAGRHLLGVPLIVLGAVLAIAAYAEWVRNQRALRRGILGSAVKLGDDQLAHVWRSHVRAYATLDIQPVPELYITQHAIANASRPGDELSRACRLVP